jgi:hypothetical protein
MERASITGNRLVLAGAVMYLLEWVAIIPSGESGPAAPGASNEKVLSLYQDNPKAIMFLVTWLSLVLLGRVLLMTGLRRALDSSQEPTPLMDLAIAAMALSVALEIVTYVFVGAAQVLASQGGQDGTVVALDRLGGVAFLCVLAPLGLAVLLAAWSMLTTQTFPRWIPVVGLLGGAIMAVGGAISGPGFLDDGALRSVANGAGIGIPLFWVWMIATGIVLWRRTPARVSSST